MEYNRNLSESLAVVGRIAPSAQVAGALSTASINLALHRRVMFLVLAGTPGASGTVDFTVTACATTGGSFVAIPASAAAIVQLTATGDAIVEVRSEDLAAAGLGPFIQGKMTVGTATSPTAVIALAGDDRYEPASANNLVTTAAPVVY